MSTLRKLVYRRILQVLPLRARFERIYEGHVWSGGGDETRSGAGSTVAATGEIRAQLPTLLAETGAAGLLDIGCGDFNWMKAVDLPVPYMGVDIVESMIASNLAKHGSDDIRFVCLDATRDPLPEGYDFVMCREVLFHLSFRDCRSLLRNVLSTGAKVLLLTTTPSTSRNRDIASGGFRNLDLEASPFNFPTPTSYVEDNSISEDRIMALWRVEDLPAI
jgi:SAM-dependent methyltransferase